MSRDPLFTWKGRRVRLPGDDQSVTAKKVPSAPIRPGSLFFIPSPLEGWGVETLLERMPAEGAVVVHELDRELLEHCRERFNDHMGRLLSDPRLFWLSDDTEKAVEELFSRLPLSRLRRCELLTLNGAWLPHRVRYQQVFSRIDSGLTRWWSNRVTCIHMGPLWIRNLFDNLSSLSRIGEPWPHWGSKPILVCGAGVTLESALGWAKENRKSFKLLAVDTALPVLKSAGLVPDAVVCLEAQHANLRDFLGWTNANIDLFCDLTAFPPGTRILGGAVHWFISQFTAIQLWDRWPWSSIPLIPPLGSVGVAAVWLGQRLTTGNMILAGLDFSFPSGKSHARGAPSISALNSTTNRFHPMEQVGVWYKTGPHYSTSKGWLSNPVMLGYGEVLKEMVRSESHRIGVWDNRGIDLGLKVNGPEAFATAGSGLRPPSYQQTGPSPKDWLEKEAERWTDILESFQRINEEPGNPQLIEALLEKLQEVDYLTFCFPDPEPKSQSDWLIRAQIQIRWIQARYLSRQN